MNTDQEDFKRGQEEYDRKEGEFPKSIEDALIRYEQEALGLMQYYVDRHDINETYEADDLAIIRVATYLFHYDTYGGEYLPLEVQDTVVEMNMGIIDLDEDYVDHVYRTLKARA